MYGMINQGVRDLVMTKFGEDKWLEICREANLDITEFISMEYYPDEITYRLVGAASKILQIRPDIILTEYGKFWVLYTAKEGYGPLMDLFGSDFKSCLQNLNNLHSRMGMTMPNMTPPRLTFSEPEPGVYHIVYESKRQGLNPMVMGLIEGLAARYGQTVQVEFFENTERNNEKTFKIKLAA